MKIYFPDDPIKQEMLEVLIELKKYPYLCEAQYKKITLIIERASGMSIEPDTKKREVDEWKI